MTEQESNVSRYECDILRGGMVDRLNKIDGTMEAIWEKIDGRPSWAVLVLISLQSSIIVGLVVGILMWFTKLAEA